ncbi:MAG TPA: SDR family NAD(P)-dependent oxidoreductase [Solirubrobacteraceae bacterium]|nr:SDR family NAD(P)-dependent oxidoreductase [Solirubrobacteraceae bacterium]
MTHTPGNGRARVAVVTGGGSGIGAAIVRELCDRGYQTIATDVDGEAAESVAAERANATSARLDVTDADAARQVAEQVWTEHGRLDVWVSNAGISHMAPFTEVTPSDLDRTLAINLKGVFVCGQAAARVMRSGRRGGVIVNTASMAGKQGRIPFLSDYVASKFGVVGLTQAMAFELAADGIRVNSVCPGYVATPMQSRELDWEAELRGIAPEQVRQMWVDDTPMRRLETPEDVARVVAFLVSEDAAFVTGEAVAVNGGAFMD